ncbi:MAG TPA: ribonuclease Z [Salinibacter sp.]|nr:ribonuclease Z [Salinibacter sp.]
MTTDVIPLGTASAMPTADRHLSALAVERKGRILLFDCGEGTQYRLMDADLSRARIDAVFITHLHGDHCYGLPGLLSTMALQQRTEPVTLVVPTGTRAMLDAIPGASPADLPFPVEVCEVDDDFTEALVYETEELTVTARPLQHRRFAMGFRLAERTRPGRFHPERARELGVPEGPAFARLQNGASVTTDDGTTVQPEQVMGPPRPGIAVAYVTDTRPCDGARALARNADLLYHDATFTDTFHARAVETGHSTAREAAEVARDAGARRLLLGHISARYDDPTPLEAEAKAVFPTSSIAKELRRYQLDPREKEPDASQS